MTPLTQAYHIIINHYGQGKRRFEYDNYTQFTQPIFRNAIHKLKWKTGNLLIRKPKAYYHTSPLAYEFVT